MNALLAARRFHQSQVAEIDTSLALLLATRGLKRSRDEFAPIPARLLAGPRPAKKQKAEERKQSESDILKRKVQKMLASLKSGRFGRSSARWKAVKLARASVLRKKQIEAIQGARFLGDFPKWKRIPPKSASDGYAHLKSLGKTQYRTEDVVALVLSLGKGRSRRLFVSLAVEDKLKIPLPQDPPIQGGSEADDDASGVGSPQ